MTPDVAEFGCPSRFHLRFQWLSEAGPAEPVPAGHGWSMGRLTLTVANRTLVAQSVGDHDQDSLCWFLGPLFHWFADNWIHLFHEEHFAWQERSDAAPAAACEQALALAFGTETERAVQQWYFRHCIAAAAEGGLFPDIYFRRFSDDVEISWNSLPSPFAPDGFTFVSEPGRITLPVEDVALPVWDLLCWVRENPPVLGDEGFRKDHQELVDKVQVLSALAGGLSSEDIERFQRADMSKTVLTRVKDAFDDADHADFLVPVFHESAPLVIARSPAMALFGGVDVDISHTDVLALREVLKEVAGGGTTGPLLALIHNAPLAGRPWDDGYRLADDFLDSIGYGSSDAGDRGPVPVAGFCEDLGIEIKHLELDTGSVRGVALAGEKLRPCIVVNRSSFYNGNERGRRFTVAHELCHIVHDQSSARELAHISGSWASPAIEKRANAFAAWILMPRHVLIAEFYTIRDKEDPERVREVAERLQVTEIALIRHLYNLGIMHEAQRDFLLSETGYGTGFG